MGRLALVTYSLIKDICEDIKVKKKKFKGKIDLGTENDTPKTAKKDTKEIRKLMVKKAFEKATKPSRGKKRKHSPIRFSQREESEPTSDSGSSSDSTSGSSGEISTDGDTEKSGEDTNSGESDGGADTNAET